MILIKPLRSSARKGSQIRQIYCEVTPGIRGTPGHDLIPSHPTMIESR